MPLGASIHYSRVVAAHEHYLDVISLITYYNLRD